MSSVFTRSFNPIVSTFRVSAASAALLLAAIGVSNSIQAHTISDHAFDLSASATLTATPLYLSDEQLQALESTYTSASYEFPVVGSLSYGSANNSAQAHLSAQQVAWSQVQVQQDDESDLESASLPVPVSVPKSGETVAVPLIGAEAIVIGSHHDAGSPINSPAQISRPALGAFDQIVVSGTHHERDYAAKADQMPLANTNAAMQWRQRQNSEALTVSAANAKALRTATNSITSTAAGTSVSAMHSVRGRSVFAMPEEQTARSLDNGDLNINVPDGTALTIHALPNTKQQSQQNTTPNKQQANLASRAQVQVQQPDSSVFDGSVDEVVSIKLDQNGDYEIIVDESLFDPEGYEPLTVDVSALGNNAHPSVLKIDGAPRSKRSVTSSASVFAPEHEHNSVNSDLSAEASTGTITSFQDGTRANGNCADQGGVVVSAADIAAAVEHAQQSGHDDLHFDHAYLDLNSVRYEAEADGRKKVNFDLVMGTGSKLVLKDKTFKAKDISLHDGATFELGSTNVVEPQKAASMQVDNLTATTGSSVFVQPQSTLSASTIKLTLAHTVDTTAANVADSALTGSLVAQDALVDVRGDGDVSSLDVVLDHGSDMQLLGGAINLHDAVDTIGLTFSQGQFVSHDDYVRFVINDNTKVEVDLSSLDTEKLSISQANSLLDVIVERQSGSGLLSISGAEVNLPSNAEGKVDYSDLLSATSASPNASLSSGTAQSQDGTSASADLSQLLRDAASRQVVINFETADSKNTIVTGMREGDAISGGWKALETDSAANSVAVASGSRLDLYGANSSHKIAATAADEVVGINLGVGSDLYLHGSGMIGTLQGAGDLHVHNAAVQVVNRQGERADVAVTGVDLRGAKLEVKDLGASHFTAFNSTIDANSIIIASPFATKDAQSTGANASAGASASSISSSTSSLSIDNGVNGAIAANTAEQLKTSFKSVNSTIKTNTLDVSQVSGVAQVVGGSVQAQRINAHQLNLQGGTSAFVQDIELKGIDSVLSLGHSGNSSDYQFATADTTLSGSTSAVNKDSASVSAGAGASASAEGLRSVVVVDTELEPSASSTVDGNSNSSKLKEQQQKEQQEAATSELYGALLPVAAGKHTSLVAANINLNGGLLQLYSADPHESVSVFAQSISAEPMSLSLNGDQGASAVAASSSHMALSGNIIIGRNSALGVGPDLKSFKQALDLHQNRSAQEREALRTKLTTKSGNTGLVVPLSLNTIKGNVAGNSSYSDDASTYGYGPYMYVDRAGIELGDYKIIMGSESLEFLQQMLNSSYSIYLGLGSTMQISSRALHSGELVFSDMDGKTVASNHGALIVPVNTTSRDIANIFGSGVILNGGDTIHISTENRLFTGMITSSKQLQGKVNFDFNMTENPRQVLSNLSNPTYEQVLKLMSTATKSYKSLDEFNAALGQGTVNTQSLDSDISLFSADEVTADTTDATTDLSTTNGAIVTTTTNTGTDLLTVFNTNAANTGSATENLVSVISDANTNTTTNTGLTTDSISNDLVDTSSTTNTSSTTVTSGSGSASGIAANGAVVDTTGALTDETDLLASSSGSGSSSSSGSGSSSSSGSGSGVGSAGSATAPQSMANNNSHNNGVVVIEDSIGYQFLMDALGALNNDAIEQVARMATLGGALHSVYLVNNTTLEAVNSRLGVGVNAALNKDRTGNITISDNGAGSSLWLTPMYRSYNADDLSAQGREYGTDLELYGMVMGLDYATDRFRLGVMWNVGAGNAEGKDVAYGIDNDFDFYGFGIYGGYNITEKLRISADISYNQVNNELSAAAELTDWGMLEAETDSTSLSAGVGVQYTFTPRKDISIAPHAAVRYSNIDLDSYDVKVDGQKVAHSNADAMDMVSLPVGVTLARVFEWDTMTLRPAIDFTVTANVGDIDMQSQTAFDGVYGADFEYTTDILDRFTYGVSVGLSGSAENIAFGLNVGYTCSANSSDVLGSAQLRYTF